MVKIAKPIDFTRIVELKEKIYDDSYMEEAIVKIAEILTNEIIQSEFPPVEMEEQQEQ
jgi:hypothetical protein